MLAVSSGAATSSTSSANQQNLVTLDFPTPLAQRVLDALRADPKSVDLRQQAPHFYALAAKVLDLFEDDEVVDVLVEVCFTLLIVLVMSLSCAAGEGNVLRCTIITSMVLESNQPYHLIDQPFHSHTM